MPLWILWAALVVGGVFQIWYTIAWIVLPHHHGDFQSVGKDAPLVAALGAAALRPGMYMIPHYGDFAGGFKDPELTKRSEEGPCAWFVSMKPGCEMGPMLFVSAYLINALEVFALALLVHWVGPENLPRLGCVLGFSAMIGLLARVGSLGSQSLWMKLPWRYTLTNLFDGVVAFSLAGIIVHVFR
jgi:hypothetical protein